MIYLNDTRTGVKYSDYVSEEARLAYEKSKAGGAIKVGKADVPISNINPSHYRQNGIELIDFMESRMSTAQMEGFLQGNILKYLTRYKLKNGVEDLRKAEWYLHRLIETQYKIPTERSV